MIQRVSIESLKFENLSFSFDKRSRIIDNCSFEFPMNQNVWIKAESGSGRSTLLQILGVLQLPHSGGYFINGENICEMSFEEFLPYRLNIGFGFDQGGVIHNRTIFENLMLPLLYHKIGNPIDAMDRVDDFLAHMGIMKYRDQRPSLVPGTVRKIACLLRALVMHPELVLLDDPSVGLGQEAALKYFDLIKMLREKNQLKHVFISSFDEKIMSLIEHSEIFIDSGILHFSTEPERKVVAL